MQLIILVETKSKDGSDCIYLRSFFKKFYNGLRGTKLSFVTMNGKTNYLKKENDIYGNLDKIPMTSTGKVRRELKSIVLKDSSYRNKVYRAINTDPHVYNLLVKAFQGGYTHANYFYTDMVLKNVKSFDFTSSYPYVMVTHKYPSTEFKKC